MPLLRQTSRLNSTKPFVVAMSLMLTMILLLGGFDGAQGQSFSLAPSTNFPSPSFVGRDPTEAPSPSPFTEAPSLMPSETPIQPTDFPTESPTDILTIPPATNAPTTPPPVPATAVPSAVPTIAPSAGSTDSPSAGSTPIPSSVGSTTPEPTISPSSVDSTVAPTSGERPTQPSPPPSSPTLQPTVSAPTQNEEKVPLSVPAIAGIAAGGGLVLLVLAWVFCCRTSSPMLSPVGSSKGGRKSSRLSSSGGSGTLGLASSKNDRWTISVGGEPSDDVSAFENDTVQRMYKDTHPEEYEYDENDMYDAACDESLATTDYDYSKEIGRSGPKTAVSSANGTLGDETRTALGGATMAYFDAENRSSFTPMVSEFQNDQTIHITAPPGRLGLVLDTRGEDGCPIIHGVKETSVIADQIRVGDRLVAVDGQDVRNLPAIGVAKIISSKNTQPRRQLTVLRATDRNSRP